MTKILKIGQVQKVDSSGYIINQASFDKIMLPWSQAVWAIKTAYVENLGGALHSIYVRGSVSRGSAIEGVSDIDTFAITSKKPEELDMSWVRETRRELKSKYSFATGFELMCIDYHELFEEEYFGDRFMIKTQSVCVHGEDLSSRITPIKADISTAKNLSENLSWVYERTKTRLANTTSEQTIKDKCRWAMKRILRQGFILVMSKQQVFSRDLYPCYELFSKHYPTQEPNMKKALEMAINPTGNTREIIDYIDSFGVWLQTETNNVFH